MALRIVGFCFWWVVLKNKTKQQRLMSEQPRLQNLSVDLESCSTTMQPEKSRATQDRTVQHIQTSSVAGGRHGSCSKERVILFDTQTDEPFYRYLLINVQRPEAFTKQMLMRDITVILKKTNSHLPENCWKTLPPETLFETLPTGWRGTAADGGGGCSYTSWPGEQISPYQISNICGKRIQQ